MLAFRRRDGRHRRLVSTAVAVFQLAAVTWVPVVHPLLHGADAKAGSVSLLRSESLDGVARHHPHDCWVCLIPPAWVAPAEGTPQTPKVEYEAVRVRLVPVPAGRHDYLLANAIRAPPSN